MNQLVIDGISKTYANGVQALNNISLSLSDGMFGLLGPNGAGKSTLMRTIAALQVPSSGRIYFNGTNVIEQPEAIRRHLGYLPQEFGVYPKISAQDLLDHIAVMKGMLNRQERREQIAALLQQVNLYQHRKKSVYRFSGGMRQRFGVAQALLGKPRIIIVDEPTAGLDPEERQRFLNLLSEIGEQVIVILSTHIVEDIRGLCANMAILGEGKLICMGNPHKLTAALDGQIWVKTIEKSAIHHYREHFSVLSTRLHAGRTQIEILSPERPEPDFEATSPDLENVYFSTLLSS